VTDTLEELVTFAPDGTLVTLDGTPAPELGPWKVCDNTLLLAGTDPRDADRLRSTSTPSLHAKAVARRRKRKRGGPR
jgi:hypothetical protein